MSIEIAENNPSRDPAWRWKRAQSIVNNTGLPTTRRRDGVLGYKWINRAKTFLREYNECTTEVHKAALAERRPAIFWAYRTWIEDSPRKASIEAQILARSDDYAIAFRAGMPPEVIEAYEALFFNVREKLNHRGYILHTVIGPALQQSLTEKDYRVLWKVYGYFLGPYIVDALESKFSSPTWCGTPESVGSAVIDDAIGTLKLKAAIAAKTVGVTQHTQLALMETFTKFIEVERNTDSSGKSQEQILDHIAAMMSALPFSVGGRAADGSRTTPTVLNKFDKTAVELTYEETMRLALNQPIMHTEILEKLTYPDTTVAAIEAQK